MERAILHQQRGGDAAQLVEFALDDGADAVAFGVGLVLFDFGEHQDVVEQVVDAQVGERAQLDHDRVAAPGFGL
jgi:hypothetical protein